MACKHMNKHPTSLVIRDMQIKTTMRYCYIPTRMVTAKKNRLTSADKDMEQLELLFEV